MELNTRKEEYSQTLKENGFGLRDYYSTVKGISSDFATRGSNNILEDNELYVIVRKNLKMNFSGLDDEYEFDHEWEMTGEYNWKILADNYNECYHCKVAHPDISSLADLQSYRVTTDRASIIHDPATTEEQRKAGLIVAATYHFPNVSTNISYVSFFMFLSLTRD